MFKKLIYVACALFFLSSCGFAPIYQSNKNANFQIEKITLTGDTSINNYLSLALNRYTKINKEKKYTISAKTIYKKNVFSKDQAGNTLDFELIAETNFSIFQDNIFIKNFNYKEKSIMKNLKDQFQEKDYERIIKQNFSSTVTKKLITLLLIIE